MRCKAMGRLLSHTIGLSCESLADALLVAPATNNRAQSSLVFGTRPEPSRWRQLSRARRQRLNAVCVTAQAPRHARSNVRVSRCARPRFESYAKDQRLCNLPARVLVNRPAVLRRRPHWAARQAQTHPLLPAGVWWRFRKKFALASR